MGTLIEQVLGIIQVHVVRQRLRYLCERSGTGNACHLSQPSRPKNRIHGQKEDDRCSKNIRKYIDTQKLVEERGREASQ